MARAIEIIDPEGQRRERVQWRALVAAFAVALCIFAYPELRDYSTQWRAIKGGHKLARYLSSMRLRAILERKPFEARFQSPDRVELYAVESCGPGANRTKVEERQLSDFEPGVVFASEAWVRQNVDTRDPILPRFCYDPMFGSSIPADGLMRGGVFLAHVHDVERDRGDHAVELAIEGVVGEVSVD